MKSLQIRDAKARFSGVIADAENGRPTVITRHGRPAAMVVPAVDGQRLYPRGLPSFAEFLLGLPAAPATVKRDTKPLRDAAL